MLLKQISSLDVFINISVLGIADQDLNVPVYTVKKIIRSKEYLAALIRVIFLKSTIFLDLSLVNCVFP